MARKPPQSIMNILANASKEHGIPFSVFRSFADIESGFKPGAKTGSYKGLFQLSNSEFKRGGGKGSIFNPVENAKAFANVWKSGAKQFEKIMGRPPQGWETYLVHQQGVAGGPAHLKNPDAPAWKNMAATPEGRQRGARWAKKAIWGNIPSSQKKQFGSVDNVTSGQFANMWKARYDRAGGGSTQDVAFDTSAANTPPLPDKKNRMTLNMAEVNKGIGAQGIPEDLKGPISEAMATRRVGGSDSDQVVADTAPQADQNVVMVGGGENPPPVPDRRPETRVAAQDAPQTPGHRPKYQYRSAEYQSANDIGAGGPPADRPNPQDAPEAPRSALIPGTPEASRSGSRMAVPVGSGSDNWEGRAFGGSFGDLYARPDQGSTLLKDVLPSGSVGMGANGKPQFGGPVTTPPPRPPMFRDFFNGLFGGF